MVIGEGEPAAVRLLQIVDLQAIAIGVQPHALSGALRKLADAAQAEPAIAVAGATSYGLPERGAAAARIEAAIAREGMTRDREAAPTIAEAFAKKVAQA